MARKSKPENNMSMDELAKDGNVLLEADTKSVAPVPPPVIAPAVEITNPYIKAKNYLLSIMNDWKRGQIERIGKDKLNNLKINDADERMFEEFCIDLTRLGNSLSDGEPLPKKK